MNVRNPVLRGLPRRLVAEGLLDEQAAAIAVEEAGRAKVSLIQHLVDARILSAREVAEATAHEFGLPVIDVDAVRLDHCPRDAIDRKLVARHVALPLRLHRGRLSVAVGDPTDQRALTEIRFQSGATVDLVVAEFDRLRAKVARFLDQQDDDIAAALGGLDDIQLETLVADVEDEGTVLGEDADDAPLVRFINKVLLDAIRRGASDIHFEPYESRYRVRFRTDGILQEVAKPPPALAPRLAARLKVMARLDISERRVPQDGRIKIRVSKTRAIDFRVNTLPTQYGEKVVLRILDSGSARVGIESLGYDPDQRKAYEEALARPQGMILMTGPTGSGKTVSMYTGLALLNTAERNISTAEDPVEIYMEGINQVQVNPRVGLTFAEALRAFLRQDPDVVMVGEIRDLETAEIAVKAAQTGHLVLSTLHTNSAPETLTRLANMGVPGFNIATSVILIMAQRLARRLCAQCKQVADLPVAVLKEAGFDSIDMPLNEIRVFRPVGCSHCNLGYKGRIGIYEVLKITPTIARLIMEGANSLQIADAARREGYRTLRQSALKKVAEGIIGLEEANRVTMD
ncbi:MAG: type IV-A pilus assembly ATPase PilB [Pseudomonadota bacterium]|jgi:type IV pilus assembly protein PilB